MQEGVRCSNGGLCNGGLCPVRPRKALRHRGWMEGRAWEGCEVFPVACMWDAILQCRKAEQKAECRQYQLVWSGLVAQPAAYKPVALWHSLLLLSHLHGGLCSR